MDEYRDATGKILPLLLHLIRYLLCSDFRPEQGLEMLWVDPSGKPALADLLFRLSCAYSISNTFSGFFKANMCQRCSAGGIWNERPIPTNPTATNVALNQTQDVHHQPPAVPRCAAPLQPTAASSPPTPHRVLPRSDVSAGKERDLSALSLNGRVRLQVRNPSNPWKQLEDRRGTEVSGRSTVEGERTAEGANAAQDQTQKYTRDHLLRPRMEETQEWHKCSQGRRCYP
jgi:hypothetical protein